MISREEESLTRTAILERPLSNREGKIQKSIEEKIEDADILTDFDGTMIREESQYLEILAYFLFKDHNHIKFVKEVAKEYLDYKKNKDVSGFYSLFKGCPVKVLDKVVKRLSQNEEWDELIKKEKPGNVGVLSRNNWRIISGYLNQLNYPSGKITIAAANIPEIENGIYTGKSKISVSNENLAFLIGKKEYICKEEERKIIGGDFNCKRLKGGIYICKKKRIF
ncbi:Uncharacterised protein [uncultured archaeon]|nr:Uncharacterised protein [uncultured archaeon]